MINGTEYPLWQQFVDRKSEWIGGTLRDEGDNMDRQIGATFITDCETEILDIELVPNGKEDAFFRVVGEDFNCGFSCEVGGIIGKQTDKGWIRFGGYGGHQWQIKQAMKAIEKPHKQRQRHENI